MHVALYSCIDDWAVDHDARVGQLCRRYRDRVFRHVGRLALTGPHINQTQLGDDLFSLLVLFRHSDRFDCPKTYLKVGLIREAHSEPV